MQIAPFIEVCKLIEIEVDLFDENGTWWMRKSF
jgi:hypothetical protein